MYDNAFGCRLWGLWFLSIVIFTYSVFDCVSWYFGKPLVHNIMNIVHQNPIY
jgi:hypothetical protein